jgi:diguanylate cyclase
VAPLPDIYRPPKTEACAAHYGGEEFVILLPETGLEDAVLVLNRLRRELTRFEADDTEAVVLKRADEAMYEAKKSGKNRVVSA